VCSAMRSIVFLSVVGLMGWPALLRASPTASVGGSPIQYGTIQSRGSARIGEWPSTQVLISSSRWSSYAKLLTHGGVPSVFNLALVAEPSPLVVTPFEDELSAGVTSLFKSIRYGIRRTLRFLRWSASRWAAWMLRALGFFALAMLAPLVNRDLLRTWWKEGWHGLRDSILLGGAVYMRLLLDRQAPFYGKLAIALALAYGVASRDFVPDAWFPLGALDDILAIVLASRAFMLLCPESLVEAHAILAARGGESRHPLRR